MFRGASKWLLVLLLITATGGHWAFLQTAAWVGMAIDFSRTDSLSTALQKTFDGKHPCKLCKVVNEGRKATHDHEIQKPDGKLDFFCDARECFALPHPAFPRIATQFPGMLGRSEPPPLPPPRLV